MKKVFSALCALLFVAATYAQTPMTATSGQLWNVSSAYYGTINANTVGACTAIDTAKGTTVYLSIASWLTTGTNMYDSARVVNRAKGTYRPVPFTSGLPTGRGTISLNINAYKAAVNNPTVVITAQESANGVDGWVTVPGVSVQTITPTSTSTETVGVFNISEAYNKYYRVKVTTADTAKFRGFWQWNKY